MRIAEHRLDVDREFAVVPEDGWKRRIVVQA